MLISVSKKLLEEKTAKYLLQLLQSSTMIILAALVLMNDTIIVSLNEGITTWNMKNHGRHQEKCPLFCQVLTETSCLMKQFLNTDDVTKRNINYTSRFMVPYLFIIEASRSYAAVLTMTNIWLLPICIIFLSKSILQALCQLKVPTVKICQEFSVKVYKSTFIRVLFIFVILVACSHFTPENEGDLSKLLKLFRPKVLFNEIYSFDPAIFDTYSELQSVWLRSAMIVTLLLFLLLVYIATALLFSIVFFTLYTAIAAAFYLVFGGKSPGVHRINIRQFLKEIPKVPPATVPALSVLSSRVPVSSPACGDPIENKTSHNQ